MKPRPITGHSEKSVPPQLLTRVRLSDTHVFLVLLGINLLLSLVLFDPKLSTAGDNATYITLARSILKGSYRNLYDPLTPPNTLYPPGFPALIAPAVAIAGSSFIPMKLVILLCSLGALLFSFLLLKRIQSGREWIGPLLLVALCPLLLDYSHWIFSEVPFLFFTLLALWLFQRALQNRRESLLQFVWAAVATGAAYYIRSQGLFLIGGFGMVLLLKRRWRALLVTAAVIGAIALPWFIRNLNVPHGGYLPWLLTKDPYNLAAGKLTAGDMVGRFGQNSKLYVFKVVPQIVFPALGDNANPALMGIIGLALVALIVAGLVTEGRRRRMDAVAWYTLLTSGIVLVWPSVWSGDRFLLPIVPFLFYYLYSGLCQFGAWLKLRQLASVAVIAAVVLFLVTNLGRAGTNLRNFSEYVKGDKFAGYDEGFRTYFQAAEWLRDHTDTNAVVVSRKPQFTYLYSGRKSFVYPFVADENQVLGAIDSLKATHVFLETFFGTSGRYLYPVIRDHPDRFQQIGTVGRGQVQVLVYEVKR